MAAPEPDGLWGAACLRTGEIRRFRLGSSDAERPGQPWPVGFVGGFKSSIDKEEATQLFRVRLWDQGDLIDQVFAQYDKLDEEIRTELPLKRIWVVAEMGE